jgi:thiazole synthase
MSTNTIADVNPWLDVRNCRLKSRLIVGIEQYSSPEIIRDVLLESKSEVFVVTINSKDRSSGIPVKSITQLLQGYPLTRMITTSFEDSVEKAVLTAKRIRDSMGIDIVKLDIRNDSEQIYPNNRLTLKAAEILLKDNFNVIPMIIPDPHTALELQGIGCCGLRLLAGRIRSCIGVCNLDMIKNIKEIVSIPCIGEGGIGKINDAILLLQTGVDAILVNSAIANSPNPALMARAMHYAVQSTLCSMNASNSKDI